tara:strand:+ start:754 stop:1020 length:267 start_codon:yes stop_codon:yes gene_type:complete
LYHPDILGADICYRVTIDPDTDWLCVVSFGMGMVDTVVKDTYISFEGLPDWFQGRLAVLMMLGNGGHIVDVGCRLDDETFWVVQDPDV